MCCGCAKNKRDSLLRSSCIKLYGIENRCVVVEAITLQKNESKCNEIAAKNIYLR